MRRTGWLSAALTALLATTSHATPTTNIWNPSADVQARGRLHFGIDNYFSVAKNSTKPVAFATDLGLTYGLPYGFEIGVDYFGATTHPIALNAKWALAEKDRWPALALGIQGVGLHKATQMNMFYGLLAKSFGEYGRFTAGGYVGHSGVLGSDNAGAILAWDKAIDEKWWVCVDYASGQNVYGSLSVGASYKFTPNLGLLVGYVFFPDDDSINNDTLTTQFDVDF